MKITIECKDNEYLFALEVAKIINTVDRDELINIGNKILNEWKIA